MGHAFRSATFGPIAAIAARIRAPASSNTVGSPGWIELCRLAPADASRLLSRLRDEGVLTQHGARKGTWYSAGPKA